MLKASVFRINGKKNFMSSASNLSVSIRSLLAPMIKISENLSNCTSVKKNLSLRFKLFRNQSSPKRRKPPLPEVRWLLHPQLRERNHRPKVRRGPLQHHLRSLQRIPTHYNKRHPEVRSGLNRSHVPLPKTHQDPRRGQKHQRGLRDQNGPF